MDVLPAKYTMPDTAETVLARAMAALPSDSSPYAVMRISLDRSAQPGEDGLAGAAIPAELLLEQAQHRLQLSIREHEVATLLPDGQILALLCSVRSVIRAGAAADRLVDLLQQPFCLAGQRIALRVSIGVALAPEDGLLATTLARRATVALRHARGAGSGVVQFYDSAMEAAHKPLSLHARRELFLQQCRDLEPAHMHLPHHGSQTPLRVM